MSLPYAPPCTDGKGIRQSHLSEGVIIPPDGRPISHMCRLCAQAVIEEYRDKLGTIWTFEVREYQPINPDRSLYVYDSPEWRTPSEDKLVENVVESAAAQLGRLGGKVKSEAKSTSSRANGRKGGRPKSTQSIDMDEI